MESKPTDREALQSVLNLARRRFAERPDWLTFVDEVNDASRELLGDALAKFAGAEAREIHRMTIQLAMQRPSRQERMITVRLPGRLHDGLKREADERSTNLNCLAVAKLLQPLPGESPAAICEPQVASEPSDCSDVQCDRRRTVDQPGIYLARYQPPQQRSHSVLVQISGDAPMLQVDWAFAVGTKLPTWFTPNLLDLEFYNPVISYAATG